MEDGYLKNTKFLSVARQLKDILNLFFDSLDRGTSQHLFDYHSLISLNEKLHKIVEKGYEEDNKEE